MPSINYKIWDKYSSYGDTLYKRAVGELPEMESSKALAIHAEDKIFAGSTVLDSGCGAGHYLRSLRNRIKVPFTYTGTDLTEYHIEVAKKAWAGDPHATFQTGDINDITFPDNSFDLVICCNLILHLPTMTKAITELTRVSKKWVIIRTLVSDRSFMNRDILVPDPNDPAEFDDEGQPRFYANYNIYSKKSIAATVHKSFPKSDVQFIEDTLYDVAAISRDAKEVQSPNPTTIVGNHQVNGCILLPWHFIVIEKK